MKLLIFGAGVIGSFYVTKFSEAGFNVTLLARGQRLSYLQKNGLRYKSSNTIKTANVKVIHELEDGMYYDFIFITVKEHQLNDALLQIRNNVSPSIVTMVNSLTPYYEYEKIVGKGRILPAFPGAGGRLIDGVLDARATPSFIQKTTFSEVDGQETERVRILSNLFKKSKIPSKFIRGMYSWQICHVALVVPLAMAYYKTDSPEKVGHNRLVMRETSKQLRVNFKLLKQKGVIISPKKLSFFRFCPKLVLSWGLGMVYSSQFGKNFMFYHSMNAPGEMYALQTQLNDFYDKAWDKVK